MANVTVNGMEKEATGLLDLFLDGETVESVDQMEWASEATREFIKAEMGK